MPGLSVILLSIFTAFITDLFSFLYMSFIRSLQFFLCSWYQFPVFISCPSVCFFLPCQNFHYYCCCSLLFLCLSISFHDSSSSYVSLNTTFITLSCFLFPSHILLSFSFFTLISFLRSFLVSLNTSHFSQSFLLFFFLYVLQFSIFFFLLAGVFP